MCFPETEFFIRTIVLVCVGQSCIILCSPSSPRKTRWNMRSLGSCNSAKLSCTKDRQSDLFNRGESGFFWDIFQRKASKTSKNRRKLSMIRREKKGFRNPNRVQEGRFDRTTTNIIVDKTTSINDLSGCFHISMCSSSSTPYLLYLLEPL